MSEKDKDIDFRLENLEIQIGYLTCEHCFCKTERGVTDPFAYCCECGLERKKKKPRGWFR